MASVAEYVYGLLTGLAGGRVYPVELPQETAYPAIRFIRVSGAPESSLRGPNALVRARYQIDVFAEDYSGAQTLAAAVKAAMPLTSILLIEMDTRESPTDTWTGRRLYRVMMDFHIWHAES